MSLREPQSAAMGMLLAAAAGDALGWPQELRGGLVGGKKARSSIEPKPRFVSWVRNAGSRFSGVYKDRVRAGEYSDDTQPICAVARACSQSEEWFDWLTTVELPTWRIYQRGGGASTLRAASSWSERRPPWRSSGSTKTQESVGRYWEAGGNGAAMRIAPHVLLTPFDEQELMRRVVLDSVATHGHPRAILGATTYAAALRHAYMTDRTVEYGDMIRASKVGLIPTVAVRSWFPSDYFEDGSAHDFFGEWERTIVQLSQMLDQASDALDRGSMSNDEDFLREIGALGLSGGAGTSTAVAAIYLASRAAARPLSGLLSAAFMRDADTDTIASMCGALLGAIHGESWLGELALVQDADYLRSLALELVVNRGRHRRWPSQSPPSLVRRLNEDLLRPTPRSQGEFPDGREYSIEALETLDGSREYRRSYLRLDDGQLVLIDKRGSGSGRDETVPFDDRRTDPPAVRRGHARITLFTNDVGRLASFYSRLLDVELVVSSKEFLFEGIRVAKVDRDIATNRDLAVDVFVANVDRVALLFNGEIDRTNGELRTRIVDPDGRLVRVSSLPG